MYNGGVQAEKIQQALDDVFDGALVFHAFTAYMRDYEMYCYPMGPGAPCLRYLFKHCVVANVESAVRPEVWAGSLDERLIDDSTGVDLEGYVWGVKWQCMYPGASLVADSPIAAYWSATVGIDLHEVRVETNGHNLTLVFADLIVIEVSEGHTPFVVGSAR